MTTTSQATEALLEASWKSEQGDGWIKFHAVTDEQIRLIQETVRAALALQPPPAQGWKLVPIEPTEEMVNAAARRRDWGVTLHICLANGYREMIAAAPDKPTAFASAGEGKDSDSDLPTAEDVRGILPTPAHAPDVVERLLKECDARDRDPDYFDQGVTADIRALIATIAAMREALSDIMSGLTTVKGTEMDAVLGPEYRLHGIALRRARSLAGK